jgi:hypothetical protein
MATGLTALERLRLRATYRQRLTERSANKRHHSDKSNFTYAGRKLRLAAANRAANDTGITQDIADLQAHINNETERIALTYHKPIDFVRTRVIGKVRGLKTMRKTQLYNAWQHIPACRSMRVSN